MPDTSEQQQIPPDPNDSRTWPKWMTRSVLLVGVVGVAVMVALLRG